MKKAIAAIILVLVLLSLTACGSSGKNGSLDLSKYSDEELIELNRKIQQEIVVRQIEKSVTLIPGNYYVGTDIPAGSYTFCAKPTSDEAILVGVFADSGKGRAIFYEYVYHEKTWALTLNEGELLLVDYGEVTLTVSAGVKFG